MIRYRVRPSFYDLDWMGVVNNITYVRWLEDIRSRLLDMSPYPMSRLMQENIAPAVFTTHITYVGPFKGSGVIEAQVTNGKIGRSRWELLFQFFAVKNEEEQNNLLVQATQSGCFVHLPDIRPAKTPPAMVDFLSNVLAPHTNYRLDYAEL